MLTTKNEWSVFKKYATLLDILLGVCQFTGNTAQPRNISSELAYFEQYFQWTCTLSKVLRSFLVASIVQVTLISLYLVVVQLNLILKFLLQIFSKYHLLVWLVFEVPSLYHSRFEMTFFFFHKNKNLPSSISLWYDPNPE